MNWELIDTTDNDCHDTGSKDEMLREAQIRNANDKQYPFRGMKRGRWIVRPEGYSDKHFKG